MSSDQDSLPFPLDRPTPVPDKLFRQTYGGGLITCMFMLAFYGVSVLQIYFYFLNYPKDHRAMKILVATLFSMSTLHAMLACYSVYNYMIPTYHNPLLLIEGDWSLFVAPGVGVAVCFLVQMFYTRMIYLCRCIYDFRECSILDARVVTTGKWRWFLTSLLVVLFLLQVGKSIFQLWASLSEKKNQLNYNLAFGIEMVVKGVQEWGVFKLVKITIYTMVPMCAARVASDSVTALSLCVLLHSARPQFNTGSGEMLHTLIIYSINRFLLTTLVVIVQMTALICSRRSLWPVLIDYGSTHLYVNSCLATLNSRNYVRGIGDGSRTGMGPSDFLATGHASMEFAYPHSRTAGGSLMSVGLNTTQTSDGMRTETDGSISGQKPDDNLATLAV